VKLRKNEGKNIIKPWIGPYAVTAKLERLGYEVRSEVGGKIARFHVNRLRKIGDGAMETGDPDDGMFPDSLRTPGRISSVDTC